MIRCSTIDGYVLNLLFCADGIVESISSQTGIVEKNNNDDINCFLGSVIKPKSERGLETFVRKKENNLYFV